MSSCLTPVDIVRVAHTEHFFQDLSLIATSEGSQCMWFEH